MGKPAASSPSPSPTSDGNRFPDPAILLQLFTRFGVLHHTFQLLRDLLAHVKHVSMIAAAFPESKPSETILGYKAFSDQLMEAGGSDAELQCLSEI